MSNTPISRQEALELQKEYAIERATTNLMRPANANQHKRPKVRYADSLSPYRQATHSRDSLKVFKDDRIIIDPTTPEHLERVRLNARRGL
jgi:phage antirepressor YoqD-like protein